MAVLAPTVVVHTNLRCITALEVDAEGSIWAGTSGGLVQWPPAGPPRLWTRSEGVPGLRIRRLQVAADGLQVLADGSAVLRSGRFIAGNHNIPVRDILSSEATGLPGPPVARAKLGSQWVWAVPESGLFTLSRGKAKPLEPQPPSTMVTSLAASREGDLLVGTADRGVLRFRDRAWTALPSPESALSGSDAAALIPAGDRLWIAPREGASFLLSKRSAPKQGAPLRQYVRWNGRDLVRRADGRLVYLDREGREDPAKLSLPRVDANAIAVSGATLFVVQPGGWSEFLPGEAPRHRFDLPELQGAPTTTIYADEGRIAIGTQDRGLMLIDRRSDEVRHIHEGHGLTDDWITAVAPDGDGLLVGTFVGGLLRWDGEHATVVGLPGGCITRLHGDGKQTWVGSLTGVHRFSQGTLSAPGWSNQVEPDVTDIALHSGLLWIAAGGALFKIRLGLTRS